jgi:ribonuclease HI
MSILSISENAVAIGSKISDRPRWARSAKVNVDGAYHVDLHAGSVGAVIRDHNGKFIAASTLYLLHVASAAATEAIAMREGLALATRLGCNDVIMKSDSMETIEACTGVEAW